MREILGEKLELQRLSWLRGARRSAVREQKGSP
jgi:hypothetical protein